MQVMNHTSAVAFPEVVDEYLDTEVILNVMVGPFHISPFHKMHVSPMIMHSKPDGSRRLIVDLSWPHGTSVNSRIPDNIFNDVGYALKYPTIDHIVEQMAKSADDALLYKIDLKRAYRNLRTDPCDLSVLGL